MKNISPISYKIRFHPDLRKFNCLGSEEIGIDIKKPVSSITLNSAEIEIKKAIVMVGSNVLTPKIKLNPKHEEVTFLLKEKIKGSATLGIEFVSQINDKLKGFYRSSYKYKNKEKYLATTQFEAADARRAFPCFDEPEAKATFEISVLADKNFDVISNMNNIERRKYGTQVLHSFAKTPRMSTYLVYLGVGEFEYLHSNLGKVKIRLVTTKGKKEQGRLALKLTKQFLDYYQKYFGVPYPLPKLDMIAIPDFEAGAMENWGAITFRETALLYDNETSSTATKHWIAEVVAHELAHQWFGNLTTMKWWNDLWLNESFATFMATKAVNEIYPKWYFWDQFMSSSVSEAYSLDSLKTSHPINVEVKNPEEIGEIFDAISYEKGGSVLRMLENFVGEENFRGGLHSYLNKHKYHNTSSEDLWNALSIASKQPVKEIMETWTKQMGYPIIEVKSAGSKISLRQKRFLQTGKSQGKSLWKIPISIRTKNKMTSQIMSGEYEDIALSTENWVKINSEERGFYRVKYDKLMLDKLKQGIINAELDYSDRWGIHSDLFSLCVSQNFSVKDYLNFIEVYSKDKSYLVLDDLNSSLFHLYLLSFGEKFNQVIKERNLEHFRRVFKRFGWDGKKGEEETKILMRSFVIHALGKLGDTEILQEAKLKFEKFRKNPKSLDSNLRSVVYNLAAWDGDKKTQDIFFSMYQEARSGEEKSRLLSALCNFKEEKLLTRALDFALSDDVKTQDIATPIVKTSQNPYGKNLVWPWLKTNWKKINIKLGGMGAPLQKRMVQSLSLSENGKDIHAFFKKNKAPQIDRALKQTLEEIQINQGFLSSMRKEFS